MTIEFDPAKDARNELVHGVSLARYEDIDSDSVIVKADLRRDYGEERLLQFGLIDGRLHVAVITKRNGRTRVLSLRRANRREEKRYEKEIRNTRRREPGMDA